MIQTLKPQATLVTGPSYYRSFASYEVPFRPVESVSFAETEGLASYCVAYHDHAGRVVRFDKIRHVRVTKEPQSLALSSAPIPASNIYFALIKDPSGWDAKPGKAIEYSETKGRDEFFAGVVAPSGRECKLTRLRREVAFTERYAYWPNGRMRSRAKAAPNQQTSVEYYDATGTAVDKPIPNACEERLRSYFEGRNDHEEASRAGLEDALRLADSEQSLLGITLSLLLLARADWKEGHHADALEKYQRAEPIWAIIDYLPGEMSWSDETEPADLAVRAQALRAELSRELTSVSPPEPRPVDLPPSMAKEHEGVGGACQE